MVYFSVISVLALIVTVYDKLASKWLKKRRIPEATLLIIAAAGGSAAMMLTMIMISHKTRKFKFMVGIPVIIILQMLTVVVLKKGM